MKQAGASFQLKSYPAILISACLLLFAASARGQITTNNFFNWETAPVHPVALSPDGTRLVVCNLPDARVEIYDVTGGFPVSLTKRPPSARRRRKLPIWSA